VNPYLRPLYDALYDLMDFDRGQALIDHGVIEVAPLAFMRGRTLNDAFVILDEAQNTTKEQMKMFLTRLGFGSRAVITGDVTQIDLPNDRILMVLTLSVSPMWMLFDIRLFRLLSEPMMLTRLHKYGYTGIA
jgi:hypothetical protein